MYMLTTVDNPFNPFTEFDDWYLYDSRKGYDTTSFLARIARTSDDMSEPDQELAVDAAIEEIVKENVLGLYRKVKNPNTI